jgi:hypothetical protein
VNLPITTLGGRRFLLTLGCGAACTVLVWFAKISDAVFATVVVSTVGAYIAGNVTQKIKAPQEGD